MLDPLGPPPSWLRSAAEPWAHYLNLPTLPDHLHEILLAFAFYQFVHSVIGPFLSSLVIPQIYKKFSPRTKLSWDVHVVSFVQSTLINALSLWVMFADEERQHMNVGERVYGYTGSLGLLSAMATGYFLYDLILCALHTEVFGVGMLFHAISALWVFSFGFVSLSLRMNIRFCWEMGRISHEVICLGVCRDLFSISMRQTSSFTNSAAPSSISTGSSTRST